MAFRTFAVFQIQTTNTPQPLVGSWITAGIGGPTNAPITLTLGTATSSGNDATNIFGAGSHALLLDPNGTNAEDVFISSVTGNTVTLGSKASLGTGYQGISPVTENKHVSGIVGTGTWIILNGHANNLFVTFEDGATGNFLYLGNSINMTATFRRIAKLAKVAANSMPFFYSATENFFGNPFVTSELWAYGTATDLYNVSLAIV